MLQAKFELALIVICLYWSHTQCTRRSLSCKQTDQQKDWLGYSRNVNLRSNFISHSRGSIWLSGFCCHHISKCKLWKETFSDKTLRWIFFFFHWHRVLTLNILCSHWLFLMETVMHDQTITGRRNLLTIVNHAWNRSHKQFSYSCH